MVVARQTKNRFSKSLEISVIVNRVYSYNAIVNIDSSVLSLCATTSKIDQPVVFYITSQISRNKKRSLMAATFSKDSANPTVFQIDQIQAETIKVFRTDTSVFLFAYSLETGVITIY